MVEPESTRILVSGRRRGTECIVSAASSRNIHFDAGASTMGNVTAGDSLLEGNQGSSENYTMSMPECANDT
jgi:hypothetical protein